MKSLWSDTEAARFEGELGLRVYTSRLLGREPSLVLHGGGNTSVKIREKNLLGDEETILYVKGSGWDLETIEAPGFSPVRLEHLRRLLHLPSLSDPEMVNQLRTHMARASAPTPSVEALLHALLPHRYVDHTHADAVLTLTNTPGGPERVREVYGDDVVIIPYTMPGFELARVCAQRIPEEMHEATLGIVLMNHGIFSFGDGARESYERMIELVTRAETYLAGHDAWTLPEPRVQRAPKSQSLEIARLRRDLSEAAGAPMIVSVHSDARSLAFVQREDLERVSQQGPVTPDHVIRTKRVPLLGRDVRAYAAAYEAYFHGQSRRADRDLAMLDPAPRVVLDPELGVCTAGRTAKDAGIVADIYRHTTEVIERAERLERYQALPPEDIFDVEYWDLEQAKLRRGGAPPPFAGEVALVTGAASGIGRACAEALLARGAAVAGCDLSTNVTGLHEGPGYVGLTCDVTRPAQVHEALAQTVRAFGGVDMLILNAGVFPATHPIASMPVEDWHAAMAVNAEANLRVMQASYPLLKLSPRGARVVIIGSKNVPAPGPGAAAYSASKAALNQLARVAALEWGRDRIRVNTLHPNAVFDTALWTGEVLASRAAQYGLSVEEYRRKNLLGVEVSSRHVAELAAEMCGPLFSRTTGAQLPVDGGNERVI
ncbi:MAG: bifunctional aldolase/short-chain dehydrogenase [Gammaproteobacteria bacterium]|nr:bifunctional aldolase/short-chain dehydrogenase [Gammaproteobacteria bacterium]NIR84574.1 bifunctional aldolase/short-chain dehydrogenase [Gammaproteobacteria bacterium]NIR90477.1 bifunctional aldolase/short-chain dehydrogenase [Gammaproteobacteria bacterium]NIU05625.1 bifunctional aldolase/short-chain dehydrogenase [Gammaproteobacteria bacterium]NIV52764.1 bifunctional aldolase/short-chain dehydrogenase [Gammaproteobacteria bacterium]